MDDDSVVTIHSFFLPTVYAVLNYYILNKHPFTVTVANKRIVW